MPMHSDQPVNGSNSYTALSVNPLVLLPGQSIFGSGVARVFQSSGQFNVPPGVSKIRVRVHGAGGSGAAALGSAARATGGGAGGFAMGEFTVLPNASYAVTVGVGGASVSGGSTSANGFAGGSSSFGALLSATGGAGGTAATTAVTLPGAAGGAGSGGDYQYAGAASGVIATVLAGSQCATGGAGAASILGPGAPSGLVNAALGATGGGGCLFKSGDALSNTTGATGGGGVGGASLDAVSVTNQNGITPGPALDGTTATTTYPAANIVRFVTDGFFGAGGIGQATGTGVQATGAAGAAGAGGGAGGSNGNSAVGGKGGALGGGGGAAAPGNYSAVGGAGGICAGGGAAISGSTTTNSGAGGSGLVVIEW